MEHKPNILIFDLDGTLALSKQSETPEMGATFAKLLSVMPAAIMTGAGLPQLTEQFLTGLPADANLANLYLFPDNAAQCFVYVDGGWQSQYDLGFSPNEKALVMEKLQLGLKAVNLEHDPEQVWGPRIEDRGAQISFSPIGQHAPLEAKQKWNIEHNNLRVELHELLNGILPEFSIAMGGLTTIDITRKGVTKAFGITKLSLLTDIAIKDMLYIGDALFPGGNDSVVMPTGVPTRQVSGPQETIKVIEEVLSK